MANSSYYWGTMSIDDTRYPGYDFPVGFVSSKKHHQQWADLEQGGHAPDKDYDQPCWGCHDPHGGGEHDMRTSIKEDGVTIPTANDNDTLCLACHAGLGPFASVTKEDRP